VRAPMHRTKKNIVTFCLACGLGLFSTAAMAGLIPSGPYPGFGAGSASVNVISLPPAFDITSAGKSFTSIGPIDIPLPVNPSDGTLTYFVSEGVTNSTNQIWTDYHEQLGTGVDGQFIVGSPVQFVTPPDATYTNSAFPGSRLVTPSEIDYTGGAVLPGQAISLTFSITVPDTDGSYNFTLRQFPTVVPEPASLGLLVAASLGLFARRRRL
jgi:hypothetical protein